ncbi:hypothetical protein K491DRAFT_699729 [Lophiostoma macrostomum CBS 122681]|uniref:Uncharacterized protein n=1 Tax=Lophiostoma macrostomum CBS 122681 TaxID=1314788 RepID=A0A6A6SIS1_9PLEO|nr:hypothetical protein K491DRAFT_699729 [Lophiostoma macrostomum CBS 122681]
MVTDQTCTFRHTEDWTLTQTLQWEASNFSKFGMVLAQLGMGKLYKAPRDNDEDLRELLRNTQRRAGPRYCRALETCFDMGKMQHKCRAQYLWRALENVVKPIQERYAIVNEEYEDYTRRL